MARYEDLLDEEPPAPKRGWRSFVWRHLPAVTTSLLLALLMIVVLWPNVVITVPSGRVGVLWKRFNGFDIYCWCFVGRGTLLDPRELREEGLHIIAPWDRLFIYDLRLQSSSQTINAISKDGVNVTAQMNIRYQLAHRSVAVLHKFIGPKYLDTVVGPEIGSQAREVISKYTAEEVYTSRDAIQEQVRSSTQKSLGSNLNKLVQPEAMEQPDPKHYNDFLQGAIQILDTLVLSIGCLRRSSTPSIGRPSSSTSSRSTDSASRAKPRSRSASRSRLTASPLSSRRSARAFRIPICAGAASRPL
jgi:hypothetical protein